MRLRLILGLMVAVAAAGALAGPVAASGAGSSNQESGGVGAVGSGEGSPLPGGAGVAPGAIEPLPVNKQAEEEFWAHPPWVREKEKAEREAAEHEAAAKRAAAEREAAAAAMRCVVPSLKGESLTAARRSLREAHCTLGRVIRPHRHGGALVVFSQSPGHGRTLTSSAPVAVRLGLATRR
jgi:hypothetical protein